MDIHYVNTPIPYLVEECFDGYFHNHDDLTISQILQDQEIVYQSLQRNAQADTVRSSSTASMENPGTIPPKESSSETVKVESQLSKDEAYARELQELENQLSQNSIDGSSRTGIDITHAQSSTASTLGSSSNSVSSQVARQDDIDPDNMTYEELQSLGDAIGIASRGLPDELISYLPTSTFKTGLFSKREKYEECVICFMAYKNRDKLIMLPCQHQYHEDCVTRWLKINKEDQSLTSRLTSSENSELNPLPEILRIPVKDADEAYQLYQSYAFQIGSSIRKNHNSYWPGTRKTRMREYVCSKVGWKDNEKKETEKKNYNRLESRCGCNALVQFKADLEGNWSITKFIEEHNHELASPEERHLLRSHRSVHEVDAGILRSMSKAPIHTADAFSFIAEQAGGVENVGFSKRDAYNFVNRERLQLVELGDAFSLLKIFRERKNTDPFFDWDVKLDDDQRLTNFLSVDGICKNDYDAFGDVIIFDTSYRMNKYNLVCAPIIGVNNHWQNIFFGAAFLVDETIDAFEWLFQDSLY